MFRKPSRTKWMDAHCIALHLLGLALLHSVSTYPRKQILTGCLPPFALVCIPSWQKKRERAACNLDFELQTFNDAESADFRITQCTMRNAYPYRRHDVAHRHSIACAPKVVNLDTTLSVCLPFSAEFSRFSYTHPAPSYLLHKLGIKQDDTRYPFLFANR